MKTSSIFLAIGALMLAIPAAAQESRLATTIVQETASSPAVIAPGAGPGLFALANSQQSELRDAMDALREAETDEERRTAEGEMRKLLEKEYDAALTEYEEYLDKLHERIAELREQISKRRAARMEMVDLRLQMLVHEANGLGWPDDRGSLRNLFPRRVQKWGFGQNGQGFPLPTVPSAPLQVAPKGGGVR